MSSIKRHRLVLVLFASLVIASSCLNRQFVEGRAEIISTSDTTLNDSSLIFGHIYHVDWFGIEKYRENEFEIWLENSDLKTTNDTIGYYSLKTVQGTYTIKCQSSGNPWERLIEEVENLTILENTKTEVDFYIGYTIE
jgi:hypothetical protein